MTYGPFVAAHQARIKGDSKKAGKLIIKGLIDLGFLALGGIGLAKALPAAFARAAKMFATTKTFIKGGKAAIAAEAVAPMLPSLKIYAATTELLTDFIDTRTRGFKFGITIENQLMLNDIILNLHCNRQLMDKTIKFLLDTTRAGGDINAEIEKVLMALKDRSLLPQFTREQYLERYLKQLGY